MSVQEVRLKWRAGPVGSLIFSFLVKRDMNYQNIGDALVTVGIDGSMSTWGSPLVLGVSLTGGAEEVRAEPTGTVVDAMEKASEAVTKVLSEHGIAVKIEGLWLK